MPDVLSSGASFADAIDLDASSGSDREKTPIEAQWPPSRPRSFGRPLQSGHDEWREMQRIGSDSPPPIIVKSNIRPSPPPVLVSTNIRSPPRSAPQSTTSIENHQKPIMTTQQRLRAAIQPRIGTLPSTSLPSSSSQFELQGRHQIGEQKPIVSKSATSDGSIKIRNTSPTAYLNGKELHHEVLCRLVIEISIVANCKASMAHGERLYATPVATGHSDGPWLYRLNNSRGAMIGSWSSATASTLQTWVLSHKLKFNLRYIHPTAIASTPGLLATGKTYAFLDVQYPRHGKFHLEFQHRLPICALGELGVEMPSLLPSRIHQYHFRGLTSLLNTLQPIVATPQVAPAAASAATFPLTLNNAGSNSYLNNIRNVANSMSQVMGLNLTNTSLHPTNVAWLASMISAQSSTSSSTTSPFISTANSIPGAWQNLTSGASIDEDDLLFQMTAMSQGGYNEDDEPIDADMREILSNMAEGTFHGSDALATLYGDTGLDVAQLNLYSDIESLKDRGLKTPLHDHQLQGLLWMVKAEHRRVSKRDRESRGLWQTRLDARGNAYYFNIASKKCTRRKPELPRGGINSDSMGLGKTIQIIATCLADRNRVPKGIKPKSGPDDTKPKDDLDNTKPAIKGQSSISAKSGKKNKKSKDDEEAIDSEEDYTSDCEDSEAEEEDVPKLRRSAKKRIASTDSSDTEEDSDVSMGRPITSKGKAVKSEQESSSETQEEEDNEPVRGSGKRRLERKESDDRDTKRKKNNQGAKVETKIKGKDSEKDKNNNKKEKEAPEYNETTLVICPLSVLQNWTGQVDEHCDRKKVNYYTYHGDMAKYIRKKNAFATILSKHTFVFTTYDTVRMEYRIIQKRREAAFKLAQRQAEKERKKAEGSKSAESSVEPRELDVKPTIIRGSESRSLSAESDFKSPMGVSEEEGEDIKPKLKGKGKEIENNRKWYGSDDSMFEESTDELVEEAFPRDTPLFEINWRRIVLDEAHICRNPRTQLYNAICELKGERRWAVTGTPIVNSTKDLGALAAWCGLQPFAGDSKEWSLLIERPLKRANRTEQAAGLLRKVVTSICLRRHKLMKNTQGEAIVKLPEVKFYKHTIPLTSEDRDYYSKCEAACREHLSRWADEGNLQGHQSAILTFLLRLRQMSCHRRLIGSQLLEEIQNKDWDTMDKTKTYTKTLTKAAKEELQAKLKVHVEGGEDCPICMEALLSDEKIPLITPCGHPFCKECLANIVGRSMVNTATCPMDRLPLPTMEQMIGLAPQIMTPMIDEGEDMEDEGVQKTSAKVREAMKILRATLKKDPTEKILVFSNFVQFLNIMQEEMKEAQISHARFNGTLNVVRRDAVLKSFCKPISSGQSVAIQRNMMRLEEKLQRERAAEKAAEQVAAERVERSAASAAAVTAAAGGGPSSDGTASDVSNKTSSSSFLLNSLRKVDEDIKPSTSAAKGKGKVKQRAQDDDIFGNNPSVLLISMGCGALGLNLTVASTVLLMDPWWQSSLEQQSIDRTHRIGQKRDVKVFQIIAENTVEARMLEIQAQKEGLAETAFSGMRATGSSSDKRTKVETSIRDLVRLFGLSDQETQQLTARSAAVAASRS